MSEITAAAIIEKLQWRYATKKFDPSKKIPASTWRTLEQSLVLAPSSFGMQPWKFYVIDNPNVRAQLRSASWNQPQIEEASHLVVFASRIGLGLTDVDKLMERIVAVRGVTRESLNDYRSMIVEFVTQSSEGFDVNGWCQRQTYIALGFFLSAAAMLGIDACPMEGIDPAKYNDILGITKDGYTALAVATAGYRAKDDPYAKLAKVRFTPESVLKRV